MLFSQQSAWPVRLILLAHILGGCATTVREPLEDSLQRYHEGVRWSRTNYILEYIPAEKRELYSARFADLGELRISEIDVQSVKNVSSSKATVLVRIEWYLMRQAKVQTSLIEQTWERRGRQWWLTDEQLIRGAPFLWLLGNGDKQAI